MPSSRTLLTGLIALLCFGAAVAFIVTPHGPSVRSDGDPSRRLVLAINASVSTLDPAATRSVGSDLSLLGHVYDTLLRRQPDGGLSPWVAREVTRIDDSHWRITLRTDVRFPDGKRLDAAVVAWNIERIINPKNALRARSIFAAIQSAQVIDPSTVIVHTAKPFPTLPAQLAGLFLLDPDWTKHHNPAAETFGSGPYRLVSFRTGDRAVLAARSDYWGGAPAFDTVIFRTIPDMLAAEAALETGEVDFISGFPPIDVDRINAGGRALAVAMPSIRPAFIKLNLEQGPLAHSVALRQALNYAIDKDKLSQALFGSHARPLDGQIVTEAYQGFDPSLKAYPYDPARARALIRQSGVAPGDLDFELVTAPQAYMQSLDAVQIIAAQLADVGITVHLTTLDFSSYMTRYVREHKLAPLTFLAQADGSLEASALYSLYTTGNLYSYVSDPTIDALTKKVSSAYDGPQKTADYRQLAAHFRAYAPVIFLYDQPRTLAVNRRLRWHGASDEMINAADFHVVAHHRES